MGRMRINTAFFVQNKLFNKTVHNYNSNLKYMNLDLNNNTKELCFSLYAEYGTGTN